MASACSFFGTIKSFNPTKGWGFIECDQTKQIYGQDVFLLKSDLRGTNVNKGDGVWFNVKQSPKGVQATDVQVIMGGSGGCAPAVEGQLHIGEVKSYNMQKGFGFIADPGNMFGKDVFISGKELGNTVLTTGMHVQFQVEHTDKGPKATNLKAMPAPPFQPQFPFPQMQWPMPPQCMGGCGAFMPPWGGFPPQFEGPWGAAPAMAMPQPAAPEQPQRRAQGSPQRKVPGDKEVYFGTLKRINATAGWGHIASEAMQKWYGKDIFVMRRNLQSASVKPGQAVCFNVEQGPKGPHAVNLKSFDVPAPDQVFTGVVKSFNDSKGWGFIELKDESMPFMTDIFLHKKDIQLQGGQTPKPGTEYQFTIDVLTGRAAAKNVKPPPRS
mmetsp:Transcript_102140/g.295530  ORF Transcript_102140/g.295530 Transcript_102140/m.295530 type:complete len:381 (+) Transcript_102140:42-1184(+)|eukprot:CAMPEP_0176055738 /NCGR_PEP_ID=MMETSP0120_2-20121206/27752_1 /TAXON_ID=160619 /ORGANISM="Kryptoperidinium foliaceum, Strain CCMP 1326" /LENGTH=380 /DNA_ID=CAMNT_0017389237 /DNA_START=42 /DNA_END=1184 /DNA_ORIENTATION=-